MANSKSGVADVTQLTDVAADDVRLWIEAYTYGNWPYLEGEPVTKEAQDEILARRNLEGILDPITLKYGVITQNAAVRAFPTWKKASTSFSRKYAYDRRSSSDRSSDCRRNLEFCTGTKL